MQGIFKLITSAITLYSFLCFIRIILTWMPNLSYSRFGQFLSQLCDPYLNIFRRLPLRFGMLDFSALVAFGVLMMLSTITGNLAMGRLVTIGNFLAIALQTLWGVIASLISFFIIFLIVRLVVFFMKADRGYSSIWTQIDYSLNPIIFKISGLLFGRRPVNFQNSLITSILIIFAIRLALEYLVRILSGILIQLPF